VDGRVETAQHDGLRIPHPHRRDVRLERTGPGDCQENEREVAHEARQRTDLRSRVAHRADSPIVVHHPRQRHESCRRLQAGDAAKMRRLTEAPAGV